MRLAVVRTIPYTLEVVVGTAAEFEVKLTSFGLSATGRFVSSWSVLNCETTTGNNIRCRLGPTGTAIVVPSGGPPSTTLGNAVLLGAGQSCTFAREEGFLETDDDDEWGTLIVKGYDASRRVSITANVLLTPGITP